MLTGRQNVSRRGRWQHVNERAGLPARTWSAVGVAKTHTQSPFATTSVAVKCRDGVEFCLFRPTDLCPLL